MSRPAVLDVEEAPLPCAAAVVRVLALVGILADDGTVRFVRPAPAWPVCTVLKSAGLSRWIAKRIGMPGGARGGPDVR